MKKTTLRKRLREAARDAGISVTEARAAIQQLTGLTRATMTHWWGGRAKEPRGGAVAKVADYFGVNPLWLARGEGEKWQATAKAGTHMAPARWKLEQNDIAVVLTLYSEMDPEVRAVWRCQGQNLLELMGKPSPSNPYGKAKLAKKKDQRKRATR